MPAAIDEALAVGLTVAYRAQLDELGAMVGSAFREIFEQLSALDRAQLAEFLQSANPLARGAMSEAADLTTAYLAELTNSTPAASALDFALPALDAPFLRHWHDLKEGMPWDEARAGGASQAEMMGDDVTRGGASQRMARPGIRVKGYRRVLHAGACEWCQVVATQLYRTVESGTFGHHACRCTPPVPVTANDPGAALNRSRLAELKRSGAVARTSTARERSRARGDALAHNAALGQ